MIKKKNKKCVKIYTPRAFPSGDLIAITIDESFSAFFTLKYKFPQTNAKVVFDLALTFLNSAFWDRGFIDLFTFVKFYRFTTSRTSKTKLCKINKTPLSNL